MNIPTPQQVEFWHKRGVEHSKATVLIDEMARAAGSLPTRRALWKIAGLLFAAAFGGSTLLAAGHCLDTPRPNGCFCTSTSECNSGSSCTTCGDGQKACAATGQVCCKPGTSQGNSGTGAGGSFCSTNTCCCSTSLTCASSAGANGLPCAQAC